MQQVNLNTLIPAIVFLVTFVASSFGKQLDQMAVSQIVTASVSLIGTLWGIFTPHQKPVAQPQQTVVQQAPAQQTNPPQVQQLP